MFAFALGTAITGALITGFGVAGALVVAGLLVPGLIVLAWLRLASIDRDARPIDTEALELLRRLPIFAPLSAPSIDRILAELERVDVPAGEVVIREGDAGDRFYVIAEGRVAFSVRGDTINEGGPGDYFGEIALLRDVPRTATAMAITPLRLIAIERNRFLEAVTGHPQTRASAEEVAAERLSTAHR
jgi:signal-transduction protein with cAMP-binding, CBS, and nucleotidyltransferase domain